MVDCSPYNHQDYIRPSYELDIPDVWNIIYFYLIVPVAYIGSILTMILMITILLHKPSICDILVGVLAINDFCLVMLIFTPTVDAQTVNHWFGVEVCYMHYMLMSCERFWAICKPRVALL